MRDMPSPSFRPLYDPTAVEPMRDELTRVGIRELLTAEAVDDALGSGAGGSGADRAAAGSALLVINSVCGCAAGNARPGVMLALQHRVIPDQLTTVFAGQDRAATERARSYIRGYPPSSPCIVLFRDGEVAAILERHHIEGRSPVEIAADLVRAFDEHCSRPGPSIPAEQFAKIAPQHICGSSIPRFGD